MKEKYFKVVEKEFIIPEIYGKQYVWDQDLI